VKAWLRSNGPPGVAGGRWMRLAEPGGIAGAGGRDRRAARSRTGTRPARHPRAPAALRCRHGGPLTANPDPAKFVAGLSGNVFVTGALTGLARGRSTAAPDRSRPRKRHQQRTGFHSKNRRAGAVFLSKADCTRCRPPRHALPARAKATGIKFRPVPLAYGIRRAER